VDYLEHRELNLSATLNLPSACIEADFVLVATPTDYNDQTNSFDTSSVEDVVKKVSVIAPQATIIIKSTIPLGFTEKLIAQGYKNIVHKSLKIERQFSNHRKEVDEIEQRFLG